MALRCDHCHRGTQVGHMVSHAKNRLRRLFRPNLQKLLLFRNGKISVRVKFCTRCVKKIKKEGKIGNLFSRKIIPEKIPTVVKVDVEAKKEIKSKSEKKVVAEKSVPKLDIESIVGKKK